MLFASMTQMGTFQQWRLIRLPVSINKALSNKSSIKGFCLAQGYFYGSSFQIIATYLQFGLLLISSLQMFCFALFMDKQQNVMSAQESLDYIRIRGVQPSSISGSFWKKRSCLQPHIKYIATQSHKTSHKVFSKFTILG